MPMFQYEYDDERRPVALYSESWNMYFDKRQSRWFRVRTDDPRGTHQYCVKGVAVDLNFPQDALPLAHAMTSEERREIDDERARWQQVTAVPGAAAR